MRRRLLVAAGVLAAAGLAALLLWPDASAGESTAEGGLPPGTTKVVKTTLVQTVQVGGTLSYGVPQGLKAPPGGGTLTWMPPEGATVGFGAPAYKVNNLPVVLIKGTVPLYRTLQQGVSGPDVLQLEQFLKAEGYLKAKPNSTFGSATTAAVKDWQDAVGRSETGVVEPGQILVQPTPIRLMMHNAELGDQLAAGTALFTFNTTVPKVIVGLDVAKQYLVAKGLTATVVLPNGKKTSGKVASVSTVATQPAAGSNEPPHVPVVITLTDPKVVTGLDSAPVDVQLVAAQKKGVLAVPVNALVALAEGGYGVQVVDGTTSHYVAVQLGLFAGGKVEVSGSGLSAGTTIGVPA
ncbi:peptidoglycan-binding protein [Kribbella italica]|uniref:Peptidoglycan hydrolase-like protein with peptidoglycan-binding domain n=1 Tax=Kribbella italica TaxID=1540520 RepID=A0A7W9JCZ6_9ACTN|nr:peptidoglycan-binding protein [Kribbella italica]MBB5839843.1 peptidoglycan hydrolase-like protein with peptidoglycan-binding domain [Kribbella italica]